jgi:hypothetical protein
VVQSTPQLGGDDLGANPMPIVHDVSQVLGDYSGFYLFSPDSKIKAHLANRITSRFPTTQTRGFVNAHFTMCVCLRENR